MKTINLAVNGTLMRDLELNQNLLKVGAKFVQEAKTEPTYRLWSIDDKYPAMQRVNESGTNIDVEIWAVPLEGLAQILLQEPSGLCIGKVRLEHGEEVLGVVAEAIACAGKQEITTYGGWRNYIQIR
ncbi:MULTISPECIES: gamma-glutamylcyclotransferase [Spirulina sp. CCY15215]|uniref:allophanate hydrolase-related protein n=1 Tax=Spirulina sp. CCY15215 TaxID=2767591 RepID=UPI0019525408|nr:gamma-glutamylcyclotransferase [Spirulina major]